MIRWSVGCSRFWIIWLFSWHELNSVNVRNFFLLRIIFEKAENKLRLGLVWSKMDSNQKMSEQEPNYRKNLQEFTRVTERLNISYDYFLFYLLLWLVYLTFRRQTVQLRDRKPITTIRRKCMFFSKPIPIKDDVIFVNSNGKSDD